MESPNKARSDFLNDLMPFVIAVTRIDRLLWSKHGWQLLGELRIRLWIPGRNRPGLLRESVQSQREARQAASHSGEETEPPRGPGVWHPSVRHTRSGSSAKNRALQPPQHSQVSMETLGQIAYQRRFEKYSEFSVWALWPLSLSLGCWMFQLDGRTRSLTWCWCLNTSIKIWPHFSAKHQQKAWPGTKLRFELCSSHFAVAIFWIN